MDIVMDMEMACFYRFDPLPLEVSSFRATFGGSWSLFTSAWANALTALLYMHILLLVR